MMSHMKGSSPKTLIISRPDDAHIPLVEPYLQSPPLVIDPLNIIKGESLSYEYCAGKMTVVYGGQPLQNIHSVWYRKPTTLRAARIPVEARYQVYCETALAAHARELYHHFRDALWVSDFWALQRAEYKGLQLEMAGKLGFHVPDTLFTSDSKAAKKFVQANPKSIVKTAAHIFPVNASGEGSIFFAKKVHADEDFNYDGLEVAPAIFQQAIDHDADIRVTVVGKKVFAAAIRASDMKAIDPRLRDWRAAALGGSQEIKEYELPKSVEKKCVALVERLGLVFGAIDMVRDRQGKLWFLENNPNGQWGFIELATGQPIGRAIAALLNRD